jgi:uncharacterized protein YndB with AHSA1/START domain
MADASNQRAASAERTLVITREFDAPPDLVWKAWTEPERMMQWWGPRNFTAPVVKLDLRVGGKCLLCMRDAQGKDFWSTGVYQEIVPPQRLVMTDSFADEQGNAVPASYYGFPDDFPLEMRIVVTFEDLGGKTRMTLRHEGMPAGDMENMAGQGWNEQFDKLDELLKAA